MDADIELFVELPAELLFKCVNGIVCLLYGELMVDFDIKADLLFLFCKVS